MSDIAFTYEMPTVTIKFDGRDAARHEIEMVALSHSLRGLSRIIGVAGNFAATQKYVQHEDAMEVRVLVKAPDKGSLTIHAAVNWLNHQPFITTVVGGLLVVLVAYVFKKAAGNKEEMLQLRVALETAIRELSSRDSGTIEKLLATIEKLADNLRPAARQSVAPLGRSATSMSITGSDPAHKVEITLADSEAILSSTKEAAEVTPERDFQVLITELDLQSGSCKVNLADAQGSGRRINCAITDPAVTLPNNPYAISMAEQHPLSVRAKALLKEGTIQKLFISDAAAKEG